MTKLFIFLMDSEAEVLKAGAKEQMFRKYPKIKPVNGKTLEKAALSAGNTDWIAVEKIHGANLCFIVDGNGGVECARRKGLLASGERFYDYESVRDRYLPTLQSIYDYLRLSHNAVLYVYGELYGGNVQREIHYCDEQDFVCFDMLVVDGDEESWLGLDRLVWVCSIFHLKFAPIVRYGSLGDCVAVDVEALRSRLSEEGRIAEGIIIRSATAARVLLKKKSSRFSEKARAKKPPKVPVVVDLDEEFSEMLETAFTMLTVGRFASVKSKELEGVNPNRLIGMTVRDVLDDLERYHPTTHYKLMNPDTAKERMVRKSFMQSLHSEARSRYLSEFSGK